MTEPMFFNPPAALTIGDIVALLGAEVAPGTPLDRRITNVAPLDRAGPSDLAFFDNSKYTAHLAMTRAGACLISPRFENRAPPHLTVLRVRQPYVGLVTVARKLFPDALRPSSLFAAQGVSPGASIHSSARLESGVVVDPGAVIGPEAEIGSGTIIGPNAVIGPKVRIGRDCAIGAGASVMYALIGDRVILHPGCRIGQDGFGFLPTPTGPIKVPQLRRVIIQDNVEIGANTTIDRGQIRDTVIGEGTKIDNLVQIGHNVTIGRFCFLVSQTGISGSTEVGDYVMMGGQVGVADNKKIGNGAVLAARAGVTSDVPNNQRWGGFPAGPVRDWLKAEAVLRQLVRERGASIGTDADEGERGTE